MDKHGQLIHDVIKKGLSDADADARSLARKAFRRFRDHFPLLADILLASLDSSKKKALMVGLKFLFLNIFYIYQYYRVT